jgi:hypothetical protein
MECASKTAGDLYSLKGVIQPTRQVRPFPGISSPIVDRQRTPESQRSALGKAEQASAKQANQHRTRKRERSKNHDTIGL